jgi:pyruvate/2-oxoglutarate dehydrogenase complex dihydrolipoamide dehydrogenase (E3) component
MPSKALLRPPELYGEASRVPGVREALTGDLDARVVLRRRDEVIHGLDDSGQEPWLQERGVTIVRGRRAWRHWSCAIGQSGRAPGRRAPGPRRR